MSKDMRKRFTFRMPSGLHERLSVKARQMGISVNSLILQILDNWSKEEQDGRESGK